MALAATVKGIVGAEVKLDGLAARLDRPKGWIVKEAIASYLALEEAVRALSERLAVINDELAA